MAYGSNGDMHSSLDQAFCKQARLLQIEFTSKVPCYIRLEDDLAEMTQESLLSRSCENMTAW